MKKNLLIINQEQFGYNTATYYYCKYLKNIFDISYVCWDHGFQKNNMDNINIIYISREENFILRSLKFIKIVMNEISYNSKENSIILIKYFKVISLVLKFLKPRHMFVLDIRTGNISPQKIKRIIYDCLLKFESNFFDNITVISKSLSYKLKLDHKAHILPIGADIISNGLKQFGELNFLYVGTLLNRNIGDTIKGFKKFYNEYHHKIKIRYTIIGSGLNNEEIILRSLVTKYNLLNVIKITGQIPQSQLGLYFAKHNIGVSYVPMKEYYDCQPVTKTFEYLLSGMPVIATNTSENNKIINDENGVLINDNPDSFYFGLKKVWQNRDGYDSKKIRKNVEAYTWERIVLNNLKRYLINFF